MVANCCGWFDGGSGWLWVVFNILLGGSGLFWMVVVVQFFWMVVVIVDSSMVVAGLLWLVVRFFKGFSEC